jgi:glycosyltransferase involved in cell wall biosynthesis
MKVLISAYICAPHRGSEPGAGWNWSLAAAAENDVWVLTRERNRAAIEAEPAAQMHPRLHFVYVELPPWGLRLKKGERGIRYFTYYTLWQYAALRAARRLHEEVGFDLVHHVTFGNVWLPALAGFLDLPFLLGPVGGGPRVPPRLYPELGASGAAREAARAGLQAASRANPLTRATWRRASTIIVQNQETRNALPRRYRSRAVIRPHTTIAGMPAAGAAPGGSGHRHSALLAGRLVPWKGGSLALRAIARTPDWSLTVIGSGPDLARLQALTSQLGLDERVSFIPWLEQEGLWRAMAEADALLLPSLRDDAPFVVGEAQAMGLPVVAFDQGGPREFAGFPGSTVITVPLKGRDPVGALAEGIERTTALARQPCVDPYGLPEVSRFLAAAYENVLGRSRSPQQLPDIPAPAYAASSGSPL